MTLHCMLLMLETPMMEDACTAVLLTFICDWHMNLKPDSACSDKTTCTFLLYRTCTASTCTDNQCPHSHTIYMHIAQRLTFCLPAPMLLLLTRPSHTLHSPSPLPPPRLCAAPLLLCQGRCIRPCAPALLLHPSFAATERQGCCTFLPWPLSRGPLLLLLPLSACSGCAARVAKQPPPQQHCALRERPALLPLLLTLPRRCCLCPVLVQQRLYCPPKNRLLDRVLPQLQCQIGFPGCVTHLLKDNVFGPPTRGYN